MIYLIDYDRPQGRLVTFKAFEDAERAAAQTERLHLELRLNREGTQREVVLLEARDEHALRRTHARYFFTLQELASALTA